MAKLLFLCGSLVPGRDGVGDYTRRLAAQLRAFGNEVALVSLYDKEVSKPRREDQTSGQTAVPTFRIPYASPVTDRARLLQQEVDRYVPDWISLQYVPHGYNKYGLPAGLLYVLARLRSRAARHLMFHELWITPHPGFQPKEQFIHHLERQSVRYLLSSAYAARVVHTHLPAYGAHLEAEGAEVSPLPLFANVSGQGYSAPGSGNDRIYTAAFFSQLATPPAVITFLQQLQRHLAGRDTSLRIALLGGAPDRVAHAAAALQEALPEATIDPTGFLPTAELSRRLAEADLGVTPVKHHEIGKSGTVAAFLSHRLPVAAPVRTETTPSFFVPQLNAAVLTSFSAAALSDAQAAAQSLDTQLIAVPHIAAIFARDLTAVPGTASVTHPFIHPALSE
ncbi:hypothetical protein LEM8419_02241 [Neolewinella maritima]|uniref:Glycosyltransferase n=1 Tax=Neolewinella maritima TaxID=1383882 RepID=A0ABN8F302_9BACT|nr:glycosyltransferase [Neolewinella maritima]CAH1001340.1 hypothetical protein LEM8419_02241 [Neolewinella maritima]